MTSDISTVASLEDDDAFSILGKAPFNLEPFAQTINQV